MIRASFRACATRRPAAVTWACTLVAALLPGCSTPPAATGTVEVRRYQLEGQVLSVRAEQQELLIKHGDIEGFMPAMTMPFKVKDSGIVERVRAGDLVTATLEVGPSEAWLASVETTGSAPLTESAAFPAAAFVEPLAPGDPVPDTALIADDGRTLSLADWRGSAVAVTFIYIRCPLPQFCPLLDRRFAEVQKQIRSDPALARQARLLSVSFDPDADTPERLEAHAAKLGADERLWRFATAPRDEVDRFAARFGVNVIREADQTITHNMRTVVVGPDGRVVTVHNGSDWTAAQLVDDLRTALAR